MYCKIKIDHKYIGYFFNTCNFNRKFGPNLVRIFAEHGANLLGVSHQTPDTQTLQHSIHICIQYLYHETGTTRVNENRVYFDKKLEKHHVLIIKFKLWSH